MVSSFQKCSLVMESLKERAGESVAYFYGKCAIHNCHKVVFFVVVFFFVFMPACMKCYLYYIYEIQIIFSER